MPDTNASQADLLRQGESGAIRAVACQVLPLRPDNWVERPWGGRRLATYKAIPPTGASEGRIYGESFELAADPTDAEASVHPSVVALPDGSTLPLPDLLEAAGPALLGAAFVADHGPRLPLLPKFLDIRELLSAQAHPPGNPEAYVVVEADSGATIRLGFRRDIDAAALEERLGEARRAQEVLLTHLADDARLEKLHADLQAVLANPSATLDATRNAVAPYLASVDSAESVRPLLDTLRTCYAEMLDRMNAVEVRAGNVIYNASLESRASGVTSAEIHALGNPERREILLLEIRKPGPSLRAWDHVRFPIRPIDIAASLAAVNLRASTADDFRVARRALPGWPGIERSIEDPYFVLDHVSVSSEARIALPPSDRPRTLHVLAGTIAVSRQGTEGASTELPRGTSALLPVGLGDLGVTSKTNAAEAVLVTIPEGDIDGSKGQSGPS